MKLFKRIYYPVIGVLLCVMLVLGLVNASTGSATADKTFVDNAKGHVSAIAAASRNSYNVSSANAAVDYITGGLKAAGISEADPFKDADENDDADFAMNAGARKATFTVQETALSSETAALLGADGGTYYIDRTVKNIIVVIPGSSAAKDAVMFTAHYDTRPGTDGATKNTSAVAVMLETIKAEMASSRTLKNDLLFVFTDAQEEGNLGAYAFREQFVGFDDIYSNVKAYFNFDAFAVSGPLGIYQSSDDSSKLVSEVAALSGLGFNSSAAESAYGAVYTYTDFDVFSGEFPSVNLVVTGNIANTETVYDTAKNLDEGVISQQAALMGKLVAKYGDYSLDALSSATSSVYFSYLNLFTVSFPQYVSYILGGIIVLLIAAVIFFNVKKKAFSIGKVLSGVFAQLLTMAAALIVLFVSFFVFALLIVGFGVIPFHTIGSLMLMNPVLLVGYMLLTAAVMAPFYTILKKIFNVKASDTVRGGVLLTAIVSIILAFAVPKVGYPLVIFSILSLIVMLITVLVKDKYKARFNEDIERLFLYLCPVVLSLPLVVPVMLMFGYTLSSMSLALVMLPFMAMLAVIVPYFSYLQPVLDRLAQKLPMRTIRVERVETVRKEHAAKKGKFTEETVKKVNNEKINWRYKNYFGIAVACVAASLIIILSSSFSAPFGANITTRESYSDSIYADSLLYVWENNGSTVTKTIEVHDPITQKYISRALRGFSWDNSKSAYVKEHNGTEVISGTPVTISSSGDKTVSFTPYDQSRSAIYLKLTNASSIDKLTFTNGSGGEGFEIEHDGNDTINVSIPYNYGSFTMTYEGVSSVNIEYTEYRFGAAQSNLQNLDEWQELVKYFSGEDIANYLSGGIVLKYKTTV